ncbi:MAG: hypothetical protein ACK4F4_06410 [Hylemonella sp.]|jgi:hypothetical protein|uniref:hypothetical protein n=1 Tax=Hylemonella sp. TaxID=2066020 RepID=UPI00391A0028
MDHETTMPGLLTRPVALDLQSQRSRRLPGLYTLGVVLAVLALLGLVISLLL